MAEELLQTITWNNFLLPNQQYTDYGLIFRPKVPGWITALGWRRAAPDKNGAIYLNLWERIAGSVPLLQFDESAIVDDNTVGWQWTELPRPYVLKQGDAYIATATVFGDPNDGFNTGLSFYNPGGTGNPPPTENLVADQPQFSSFNANRSTAPPQYPTLFGTGQIFAVSVRFEPQAGSSQGSSDAASWLSATGSNYAGSPLYDIHQVVGDIYNAVQSATTGLAAIKADTEAQLTRWSETVRDELLQGATKLGELWSDILACFGSTPGALLCVVQAYLKFLRDIAGQPGPAWEIAAETDFTDTLIWNVQADRYRVHVDTFDARGSAQAYGDRTRYIHFGKWATVDVTFTGEWRYFSTVDSDLDDGGRRMPGLALILEHGGTGHVQALLRPEE